MAFKRPPKKPDPNQGIITAHESFSVEAFCKRLGITRAFVLDMRRRGLKVRADGERYIKILGSDYLEYLATLPVRKLKGTEDEDEAGIGRRCPE